jgi:hypothetical protein
MFKVYALTEIYPNACMVPYDDLFTENRLYSRRWRKLNEVVKVRVLGEREDVIKSFNFIK